MPSLGAVTPSVRKWLSPVKRPCPGVVSASPRLAHCSTSVSSKYGVSRCVFCVGFVVVYIVFDVVVIAVIVFVIVHIDVVFSVCGYFSVVLFSFLFV